MIKERFVEFLGTNIFNKYKLIIKYKIICKTNPTEQYFNQIK
jgi:hypothetical protein